MKQTPHKLWGYTPLENDEGQEYAEQILTPVEEKVQQLGSHLRLDALNRARARAAVELIVAAHKIGYDVASSTWAAALAPRRNAHGRGVSGDLPGPRQNPLAPPLTAPLHRRATRRGGSRRGLVEQAEEETSEEGTMIDDATSRLDRGLPDISGHVAQSVRVSEPLVPRCVEDGEIGSVFFFDEEPRRLSEDEG